MSETTLSANVGRHLAGLAHRLKHNPDFMAYVLAAYQTQERLDDSTLAQRLGVTMDMLSRVALCKRPVAESAAFADQVRQIAAYTGADPVMMAYVIRQVGSLEALANRPQAVDSERPRVRPSQSEAGLLAAARDRSETESDQNPASDEEPLPED